MKLLFYEGDKVAEARKFTKLHSCFCRQYSSLVKKENGVDFIYFVDSVIEPIVKMYGVPYEVLSSDNAMSEESIGIELLKEGKEFVDNVGKKQYVPEESSVEQPELVSMEVDVEVSKHTKASLSKLSKEELVVIAVGYSNKIKAKTPLQKMNKKTLIKNILENQ
jgi:uncharacterized protein YgiM (DUF1202 family)